MNRPTVVGIAATLAAALLAGSAQAESTVIVARQIDTDRYDPHISTARSTAEIMFMAGDTLVTLDYDMKTIRPGLAESWTVSDDGRTYTFKLKQGVSFCSGKPFTAADAKASIDRWLAHPKGVTKGRAGPVDALTAIDDHMLEYKLKEPYSELLYQMTQHNHTIINIDQVNELGEDFGVKAFDGTGPFCMESWEPRNQVVLVKHEGYGWGPPFYDNAAPRVDKVIWKVVPEEGTRVASMKTGQVDVTQYIPYWAIAEFEAQPNVSVSQAEAYFWTQYVGFKITRDNVSDPQVRVALNLAVDQKALAESIYFGLAEPAYAYISPKVLDYNESLDTSNFQFDPEKAKSLLDAAGWKVGADGIREKDGNKLTLRTYGFAGTLNRDMLEAMQGDLRKVGADMQIEMHDATVIWGLLAKQDFDMYAMSYPYVSTGDALNLYFRSENRPTPNRMNWADDQTDAWLAEANAALTDEARAATLARLQSQVHDAAVWIPIVHEPLFITTGPKLEPVRAHGIYGCGLYKGLGLALK